MKCSVCGKEIGKSLTSWMLFTNCNTCTLWFMLIINEHLDCIINREKENDEKSSSCPVSTVQSLVDETGEH